MHRILLAALLLTAASFGQSVDLDTGTGILHGTMLVPEHKGAVPVVLLHSGSGPTDRDGNSAMLPGHNNSLKMLAEGLAARGIASLRYDKRGIAESAKAGPKEEDLRFDMYVDDAVLWGRYLRKDARFGALVIAGHSEGALIGLVAARKLPADGYVSLSGSGRAAGTVVLEQLSNRKIPTDTMAQLTTAIHTLEAGHLATNTPPAYGALFRPSVQPYLISWFQFDPAKEIAKLKMPILILQGTTDIQITVADARLLAAANPSARLVIVDGMNHILKSVTGDRAKQIASYGDPDLPIVPEVVKDLADFVLGIKH